LPQIEPMSFWLMVFVRNTSAAPAAVTPQVKKLTSRTWVTGLNY